MIWRTLLTRDCSAFWLGIGKRGVACMATGTACFAVANRSPGRTIAASTIAASMQTTMRERTGLLLALIEFC